jgi:hypothetical protein
LRCLTVSQITINLIAGCAGWIRARALFFI